MSITTPIPPIIPIVSISNPGGGAVVGGVVDVGDVVVGSVVVGAKPPGTYGASFHIEAMGGATYVRLRV